MDRFAGKTVVNSDEGYSLISHRLHNRPMVGEEAPDFELEPYQGNEPVRLSSFRHRAPVVLIFGSLT